MWRDPIVRGVRTFVQAFLGVFLAIATANAVGVNGVPDVDVLRRAVIAASWAGVVAVIAFVQNSIEAATGRSLLK